MTPQTHPIVIDGKELTFESGESILEAARRNGVDIPTLCYMKAAAPTGACRMCLVEVEGARALLAACSTPAAPKMVVKTESPKVVRSGQLNLELLLSSGGHNCIVEGVEAGGSRTRRPGREPCRPGRCRLQELAMRYGVPGRRFRPTPPRYAAEDANPFIMRNLSSASSAAAACRPATTCRSTTPSTSATAARRARSSPARIVPLREAECVFCGECVQACPTGALVDKGAHSKVRPWEADAGAHHLHLLRRGLPARLHVKDNRIVKVTGVEEAARTTAASASRGASATTSSHTRTG